MIPRPLPDGWVRHRRRKGHARLSSPVLVTLLAALDTALKMAEDQRQESMRMYAFVEGDDDAVRPYVVETAVAHHERCKALKWLREILPKLVAQQTQIHLATEAARVHLLSLAKIAGGKDQHADLGQLPEGLPPQTP